MNKRFLSLAGVATVLSVGTYVGLNMVKPHTTEEVKVAETVPAEQVFGASVSNPEPETPAGAAAPGESAAAPAAETAAPAAAPAAATDSASTAVAPPAPAAESAAVTPTAEPAAAPAPAAEQPVAAAAPTETAAAAPPAEPAAAPEPAPAPAPVEKPAKVKKTPAAHAATQHASASKPASNKAWWPSENPNKLSLVYAGPASFKPAIVLMFNGAFFSADSLKANLKVTDHSGKPVSGNWEIGENNRRMLVFAVPATGAYKVSVGAGLTDSKGRKLGTRLSGPVQVR